MSQTPAPDQKPTRERLIRAGLELFQSRGYHAVGLAEILTKAKAPKGSLYHHFPGGKSALGVAVIEWLEQEITAQFDEAAARKIPARKHIQRLYKDTGIWVAANEWKQGALLAVMAQELVPNDPALSAAIAKAYHSANSALAKALIAGGLPADSAERIAITALSGLEGCVARARAARSVQPFDLMAESMDALLRAEGLA
ncbi:MAG: TetR/AcrR family transcriptional repressor of lmrAB and yxaGH operons [Halocynthiibacter sp.]|jgi:TetR/AcrR family transcriptional repressor of lmrAB and yxaGH operons